MFNFNDILEQIRHKLHCPVCGKKYELGEIKLQGSFSHALIIQTVCENGHLSLFVTNVKNQKKIEDKPVVMDEVLDLHNALKKFNGDFTNVWPK